MNAKRIFAIIGIVILIALYILTLIAAIFARPEKDDLFFASAFASVVFPVFLYIYIKVYEFFKKTGEKKAKEIMDSKTNEEQKEL